MLVAVAAEFGCVHAVHHRRQGRESARCLRAEAVADGSSAAGEMLEEDHHLPIAEFDPRVAPSVALATADEPDRLTPGGLGVLQTEVGVVRVGGDGEFDLDQIAATIDIALGKAYRLLFIEPRSPANGDSYRIMSWIWERRCVESILSGDTKGKRRSAD